MARNGFLKLGRHAAARGRTERAARVAAARPMRLRKYRGVYRRWNRYYSVVWNSFSRRAVWLGSYRTPEEAAYAYDAGARMLRGHMARPNFPEPSFAWWAPEELATDLALALPTPARAPPLRRSLYLLDLDPAAAAAQLASFDNWLAGGMAAAAAPQRQQQTTPPAAPLLPNQPQRQAMSRTNPAPASSALSSTDPFVYAVSLFLSAAAPAPAHQHRELPVPQAAGVFDQAAVVEDNFHLFTDNNGASTSAAPPPVPRLTLNDLVLQLQLGLPGFASPGGAGAQ